MKITVNQKIIHSKNPKSVIAEVIEAGDVFEVDEISHLEKIGLEVTVVEEKKSKAEIK
jgi:hypothetical protein